MRIAILNSFYAPDEIGGAEKSVRFLAETFVQHGNEVLVICSGRSRQTEHINGVIIERFPVKNLYSPLDAGEQKVARKLIWHTIDSYNPLMARQIQDILANFSPDVLHTNTLSGFSVSVWAVAKKLGIRIVHTLRDYYLLCPNTAMFKNGEQCKTRCGKCRLLSLPKSYASNCVDAVIGNSHYILNRHIQDGLFSAATQSVIYNAYQPDDANDDQRDTEYITFGFIGRIAPTKGVEVLIKAFRLAFQVKRRMRLLIAGDGDSDYVVELKKQARDLPVEFMGRVTPQAFYARIDWCVLPSLWDEPLARVLFESFAHGVPVIGSRTGGTTELIREGFNGFDYAATDTKALASIIEKVSILPLDVWSSLRKNCFQDAKNFLPNRVVDQYLSAYKR